MGQANDLREPPGQGRRRARDPEPPLRLVEQLADLLIELLPVAQDTAAESEADHGIRP